MSIIKTKMLILGSGPAGFTAAIYGARANLEPLVVSGMQIGGQLSQTTDVENFPGYPEGVQGPKLMQDMQTHAENMGAKFIFDNISAVDLSSRPFKLEADSGDVYMADSLIIATGANARWLGMESEEEYKNFGVSGCATCDGFFYRGKDVAVIGGGNTAVEEAIYLAGICNKVYLIHRRDELRAEKTLQDHLFANEKIEVIWNSTIEEFIGVNEPKKALTGLKLKSTKSGDTTEINVNGAFVAIGHDPNTSLFKGQLELDSAGFIITEPGHPITNIAGVFAAGDVADPIYKQAITAAGSGCKAALKAELFLREGA